MTSIQSLDPRIARLALHSSEEGFSSLSFEGASFEAFFLQKPGKPYEHAGIVHAPDIDLALLYAKEQYSRRGGQCAGIKVAASSKVWVSVYSENEINAFDTLTQSGLNTLPSGIYEVYILKKRGKQHQFLNTVTLDFNSSLSAMLNLRVEGIQNIWLIAQSNINELSLEDENYWLTLPDKAYRDAAAYKSADKINAFKASNAANNTQPEAD
jgi:ring-1,2-phenylacetyl-CoA epoxidase subunit PaaB